MKYKQYLLQYLGSTKPPESYISMDSVSVLLKRNTFFLFLFSRVTYLFFLRLLF